jgi:hypothetical protein
MRNSHELNGFNKVRKKFFINLTTANNDDFLIETVYYYVTADTFRENK